MLNSSQNGHKWLNAVEQKNHKVSERSRQFQLDRNICLIDLIIHILVKPQSVKNVMNVPLIDDEFNFSVLRRRMPLFFFAVKHLYSNYFNWMLFFHNALS